MSYWGKNLTLHTWPFWDGLYRHKWTLWGLSYKIPTSGPTHLSTTCCGHWLQREKRCDVLWELFSAVGTDSPEVTLSSRGSPLPVTDWQIWRFKAWVLLLQFEIIFKGHYSSNTSCGLSCNHSAMSTSFCPFQPSSLRFRRFSWAHCSPLALLHATPQESVSTEIVIELQCFLIM